MTAFPFCEDTLARSCADWWLAHLEGLGIEIGGADRFVIGLLASREANLRGLRVALALAEVPGDRLALLAAESRAARDFAAALDKGEAVFGARAAAAVSTLPMAVGESGRDRGRVLAMPERPGLKLASRGRGAQAVAERILAALARAAGPLTKAELRRGVTGDATAFLRALPDLVVEGRVSTTGAGRRGNPRRYFLTR